MSFSVQTASQPKQKLTNEDTVVVESTLTLRQIQKQDALALAELIYDMFKESESNANILNESRKDHQNV